MSKQKSNFLTANPVSHLFNREYNDSLDVKKVLRARLNLAKSLYSKNLLAHFGCVNAIEFSNGGELLASGGDDRRVLLWNVEEALHGINRPTAMRAQHISNIFCLGYDSKNTKIFSAGNDDQVIVHDCLTGDPIDFFLHEQPVYSLSVDPSNDNVFASACDDGRILIYDIRSPSSSDPLTLATRSVAFHGVMFNPVESRLVATANAKEGAALYDTRKPEDTVLRYGSAESCMSVRWDERGLRLLALRRRLPPVLYPIHSPCYLAQFDHPSYYNSCTMKSCCFAGDSDQFVLSGSDDFNLYMWKIPECESGTWVSSAHIVLKGHRSIVNQVRFNPVNHLIASSGVEKLIKVWSPFPLPYGTGEQPTERPKQRKVFSHEEYISLVLTSGQFISHDYSHQSTKEDPRMMAFFDSLVQREIEGWTSTDSHSAPPSPLASDHVISDDSSSSNSSSEDAKESTPDKEKKKREFASNRIKELIARKRAQLVRLAQNSQKRERENEDSSSDSNDSGTAVKTVRKFTDLVQRKRRRTYSSSSESSTSRKSSQSPTPKKRPFSSHLNSMKVEEFLKKTVISNNSSEVSDNNDSQTTPKKEPSTSSETPDSGIVLQNRPATSKHKSRSHRNYRRHVSDTESDSD